MFFLKPDSCKKRLSCIRSGIAAVTTRGLKEADMKIIVNNLIDEVITDFENEKLLKNVAQKVNDLMSEKPLFVW